jgi:hypothetical protein
MEDDSKSTLRHPLWLQEMLERLKLQLMFIAVTDFEAIKALVIEKTSKWLLLGQKTHWSKESTFFE